MNKKDFSFVKLTAGIALATATFLASVPAQAAPLRFYIPNAVSYEVVAIDSGSTGSGTGSSNIFGYGDIPSMGFSLSQINPVSEVPVPAALWLFGSVLFGLGGFAKRQSRKV